MQEKYHISAAHNLTRVRVKWSVVPTSKFWPQDLPALVHLDSPIITSPLLHKSPSNTFEMLGCTSVIVMCWPSTLQSILAWVGFPLTCISACTSSVPGCAQMWKMNWISFSVLRLL